MAAGGFLQSLPVAEQFAELLTREGVLRGLIGPREVPRLWDRHLVNCALLGRAISSDLDVCDIGSGAGLPGLVLALSRPDLRVTLVEPLLRRTTFLEEAVSELGLVNVEVVRGRAEELHGRREFSVVTSRAVAPLGRLLTWSMPLVRQGGELVAMKGSSVHEEIEQASAELQRFGGADVRVEEYGEPGVERPTTVLRVVAEKPSAFRRVARDERASDKGTRTARQSGARPAGKRSEAKPRRRRDR